MHSDVISTFSCSSENPHKVSKIRRGDWDRGGNEIKSRLLPYRPAASHTELRKSRQSDWSAEIARNLKLRSLFIAWSNHFNKGGHTSLVAIKTIVCR
jgi:hypothetical protein